MDETGAWNAEFDLGQGRIGAREIDRDDLVGAWRALRGSGLAAGDAVNEGVEAVTWLKTVSVTKLRAYLPGDDFVLDTYKGAQGDLRSWSGQLRQPILLATNAAAIARAPIEGILHPTSILATPGLDAAHSSCRQV